MKMEDQVTTNKRLSVTIKGDKYDKLQEISEKLGGLSMQSLVTMAIQDFIKSKT